MIKYIDEIEIQDKRILLRVDYNVSLNPNHTIANDERIQQTLPTIQYLLKNTNKLILVSHLGRPEGRDENLSLKTVAEDLQKLLPNNTVTLIDDFTKEMDNAGMQKSNNDIVLLENIRFYPGEDTNDPEFSQALASLADVFVNDAFSVSHRSSASVVGVASLLPAYGGLLMKKEVTMLSKLTKNPEKPFVAILGGSKISTKLKLINKLTELADSVILGGGIANNFYKAQGFEIGKSIVEIDEIDQTKQLLQRAQTHNTTLLIPKDVVVASSPESLETAVKKANQVGPEDMILDIGPEAEADFGAVIEKAKTIAWNGPVGYFENDQFRRGTDFLYYAIAENHDATSIVGGGDTLSAISKKEYLDKITHISTAGGAMLEFIENGTLPGIDALNSAS